MITIRRYSNIDDIPGLVKHIELNWGVGHRTWSAPQRWWFVGFAGLPFNKANWVCYGGLYVFSADTVVCGPTVVWPEYRGQGLQLQLLKKRIAFAKKKGFVKMLSSTYADNYPSMNNLIDAGFKTIRPWCEPEVDGMYWAKDL